MKFLSAEKRCPVTILFVNISLATVTSSTLNAENSAKVRYVDEISNYSYCFLKFEINKSNHFMKTMINHGKLFKQYQSL